MRSRLLATSRAPLRLRGEREYPVKPLALDVGSDAVSPADLVRAPAVRLFVERVRDVQPDFRLTPANGVTVTAICQRLDALPLALELAAPWIKVLTAEGLLRRLEHDVLLSTAGAARSSRPPADDECDRRLELSTARRGRTARLPPLRRAAGPVSDRRGRGGPCRPSDAPAAMDEAFRAAVGLIDKSLLVRAKASVVPTCTLYYMLETVRAYAVLELTAAGERDDALEGLVRYCKGEGALAAEGLVGPAQVEWLDRVREDLESYRAALTWLIEHGRPAEAAESRGDWCSSGSFAGMPPKACGGTNRFWICRPFRLLPNRERSTAPLRCGTRKESSRARAQRSHAPCTLALDSGDTEMVVHAELVLGHIEHAGGNIDAARDRFTRSLEGFRALAIPWGTGNSLSAMAAITLATGDAAHAERLLDQATAELREAGPWFLAVTLYVRALLAVRRGSPDEAIGLLRESLTRIRDLQDTFAFVSALAPLATAAVLKGDYAWAARIFGARDAVIERTGHTLVDTPVRDLREQPEREARAHLAPDRWDRAYAAGRRASIDALLKDIDRVLDKG